jgi:hypothetical protein
MSLGTATILLLASTFVGFAADNPVAGTWKLNTTESKGPVGAFVHNGILQIPPEIYKGGSSDKNAPAKKVAESGKGPAVYLFSPSPDGRTLTITQPQDPSIKLVFEKQ